MRRLLRQVMSASGIVLLLLLWEAGHRRDSASLLPGPVAVARAIFELAASGKLLRDVVASLYRVTWGGLLAMVVAFPVGALLGWSRRADRCAGPYLQLLRPISPLAWIPFAILWWGVGDLSAIFIIFVACFGPLTITARTAVSKVPVVHLNAARNFGLSTSEVMARIVFPSITPQLVTGVRQALSIAWIVVVMAEMMAVNSGLGYLILDSRNAGNRYDLVVAGMALISLTGLLLDDVLSRLERAAATETRAPGTPHAVGGL